MKWLALPPTWYWRGEARNLDFIFVHKKPFLFRLLDKLSVICPNSDSCKENSQRGILEDHLKYRCDGTLVACQFAGAGCVFRGPVKKMKDHQLECTFKKEGKHHYWHFSGNLKIFAVNTFHWLIALQYILFWNISAIRQSLSVFKCLLFGVLVTYSNIHTLNFYRLINQIVRVWFFLFL